MSDAGSISEKGSSVCLVQCKAQMIRIGFEDRCERINLQCKFDLAIFALLH